MKTLNQSFTVVQDGTGRVSHRNVACGTARPVLKSEGLVVLGLKIGH